MIKKSAELALLSAPVPEGYRKPLSFVLRGMVGILLAFFVISGCKSYFRSPRDYIVVVDTSGSMGGTRETYKKVIHSLPRLLDTVARGDTVTLVTFDQEVRVGKTTTINRPEDSRRVLQEVSDFKPEGLYTDMGAMLGVVKKKSAELAKAGRETVIVILSDGQDDPPPNRKESPVSLKELQSQDATKYPVQDYFIYYISLGELKDPKLEKNLKSLSTEVKVIEPSRKAGGTGPGENGAEGGAVAGKNGASVGGSGQDDVGLESVATDIQKRETSRWENLRFLGIVIGSILLGLLFLLLLIYWIYRFSNRHKLAGQLRYYEEGSAGSYSSIYSIDKLHRSKVAIGPRAGADLKIKDLGVPQAIKFKSKKIGDDFYLKPIGKSRAMLHFLDQKRKGLVSSGDKFKLGHYIFEYRHGQENK